MLGSRLLWMLVLCTTALTLAGGCASVPWPLRARVATVPPGEQQPAHFKTEVQMTMELDYLLYLPKDYAQNTGRWPLVLFLHGAGERGSDVELLKLHGPPKLIAQRQDFPCIIVSPQCAADGWWTGEPQLAALDALLTQLAQQYRVDPDRIYLTGISMGGFGTWALAGAHPDRFAAIAPICGGGKPAIAPLIKAIPTWTFHGDADDIVPLARTQEMVDALKAAGATDLQFTVYPGVGHDSWTATYANPKFWDWLLAQRRK